MAPPPHPPAHQPTSVTTTTLLLVRHGESEWNDVFNRGFGPFFPLRLAGALLRELAAWPTPGSLFLDSPLSAVGSHQAANLAKWLAHPRAHADGATAGEERARATLAAVPGGPPSVLATSNLRRSASTAAIALAERLRRTGEAVAVLSSLQEVSPNVDTLALAPPGCPVPCAPPLRCACGYNTGNKPLRSRAGASARLAAFAAWAAAQPPGVTVVAVGHSLWFRAFLDAYLPRGAAGVDARRRKLANCGVLAMTLQSAPTAGGGAGGMLFRIPPESVVNVYGGWSAK